PPYAHMLNEFLLSLYFAVSSEFSTLSLHDALPIFSRSVRRGHPNPRRDDGAVAGSRVPRRRHPTCWSRSAGRCAPAPRGTLRLRSEEHTSELQSRENLVCRLLLEKKNKKSYETIKE